MHKPTEIEKLLDLLTEFQNQLSLFDDDVCENSSVDGLAEHIENLIYEIRSEIEIDDEDDWTNDSGYSDVFDEKL
jgi:hypothetical protein